MPILSLGLQRPCIPPSNFWNPAQLSSVTQPQSAFFRIGALLKQRQTFLAEVILEQPTETVNYRYMSRLPKATKTA